MGERISARWSRWCLYTFVVLNLTVSLDILSLALVLASHSLPLIAHNKLKALPLTTLARLLTSTILSAFKAGSFLSSVSASVTLSPDHKVHISVCL